MAAGVQMILRLCQHFAPLPDRTSNLRLQPPRNDERAAPW